MDLWPFRKQADRAQVVLSLLIELHEHCNDLAAGTDMAEAERNLRHALKLLRAHDGLPS